MPTPVQVKDATGAVIAELKPLRPCRASVGPSELIVGGPPLIAHVGATQWSGTTADNGTVIDRAGERIARIYPVGAPASAAVFDNHGVAIARIAVDGAAATVSNSASVPIRKLTKTGPAVISSNEPPLTITGTDDLVLAALLSAPELVAEVRMLAACERVLVKGS